MAHLVRFLSPSGDPITEEVSDLDAAIARVQAMSNGPNPQQARVFAEVPLRVETIVRVSVADQSVPADDAAADLSDPPVPPAAPGDAPVPPAASVDAPAPVEADHLVDPAPPPGAMLPPLRVNAPSADASDLVEADGHRGKGLFHRG